MEVFGLLCVIAVGISTVQSERSTCKLGAENFNDCLKNSFNENWPSLHNPNTNEKFPLIDPFFFEYGEIQFNRSKVFKGSFALKNMTLEGQKMLTFTKIETTQNKTAVKVTANARLNQFISSGWFRSNIYVNEFLYKSKGQFHLVCDDVKAKLVLVGDLGEDGTSFNVKNVDLTPTVKNMKFNITGIGSDNNVNKLVNQFVNDSWRLVYRELISETKPIWFPYAVGISKELMSHVTLEK